jgi:hypothetical protein
MVTKEQRIHGMESVMANQIEEKQWYLAVGERSLGPISTDLVARGIRSGKVPVTAWVCQVGAETWSSLSSFSEFHEAVAAVNGPSDGIGVIAPVRGAHLVEAQEGMVQRELLPYEQQGNQSELQPNASLDNVTQGQPPAQFNEPQAQESSHNAFSAVFGDAEPARDSTNSYSDISGQREIDPLIRKEAAAAIAEPPGEDDLGIEITFDEEHGSVDWNERFQSYFLVGSDIQLPEEEKLLRSLHETPKSTFVHDEALWNLALCLAFGSEAVADASAFKFYESLDVDTEVKRASERVEWICRTLLSKGFMPSGIPRMEGNRGVEVLRRACPERLRAVLDKEATC